MGRRTITVKVNKDKPDAFLNLCEDIVSKNNELGASSPFADGDLVDMAVFADLVSRARARREEALEYQARAKAAMDHSRHLMGTHAGQNNDTPGTLINYALKIKKVLQVLNSENPEALSVWGFDVVVRVSKNPPRRKKKA
ncbi:MAG: hypothetical protein IPH78_00695 [Bacteroidetes bacterium]|nr:hypothetical protein [Bacteroidota bacterium]MBK8659298.1 hypothetical protein [Bacteroidota bacterium]